MLTRMYVVLVLMALWPLAIVGRMLWIYLGEGAALRAEGRRQVRAVVEIPAMRGEMLDRAGRALAVNTVRYDWRSILKSKALPHRLPRSLKDWRA